MQSPPAVGWSATHQLYELMAANPASSTFAILSWVNHTAARGHGKGVG